MAWLRVGPWLAGGVLMVEASKQVYAPTQGGLRAAVKKPLRVLEGVGSARQLARMTDSHDAYRWLCGGVQVNHHSLSDFRVEHGQALDELLSVSVASLMAAGAVRGARKRITFPRTPQASSTRPRVRSGNRAANSSAMEAPSLWPNNQGAHCTPSASRKAGTTSCACWCMKSTPHTSPSARGVDRP